MTVNERLKEDFTDPDYRHTYSNSFLDSSIATQIRVLREQHQMTQAELAAKAGMNQSRISELEYLDYSSWSVRTLRRLAQAFDLRLRITFEEFGSLFQDLHRLDRESLQRRNFSQDPSFSDVALVHPSACATSDRTSIPRCPSGDSGVE